MKNILSNKNPNSPTYCLLARNKHKRNSQKNEKKHVGLSKFQDITMYHKKMTHFYKSLHVHKDKKLTPPCYKTNLNISLLLLNYWFRTDEVKKKKQTNKHLVYSFEPTICGVCGRLIAIEHYGKCSDFNTGIQVCLMFCTSSNDGSGFLPSLFEIQLLIQNLCCISSNSNCTSSLYKCISRLIGACVTQTDALQS
jgi:hypothetical protein